MGELAIVAGVLAVGAQVGLFAVDGVLALDAPQLLAVVACEAGVVVIMFLVGSFGLLEAVDVELADE